MNEASSRLLEQTPENIAGHLVQRAHLKDGLPEIFVGTFFLLVAPLDWMGQNINGAPMAAKAAYAANILLSMILGMSLPWLIKWVRRRFLVEREGYVRLKSAKRQVTYILLVAAAIFALSLVAALWLKLPNLDRWILAALGLYVGAVWAFIGQTLRFRIVAAISAATGILLAFTALSMQLCLAIFFGMSGLITLLSGLVVFIRFMRLPIEAGE